LQIHLLTYSAYGLNLKIHAASLTGNALPSIFPKECRIDRPTITDAPYFGGIISPTISNCKIGMLELNNVSMLHGDFPPKEICNMCDLKSLIIDGYHNFTRSSIAWFRENCTRTKHEDICRAKNESKWKTGEVQWTVCYNGEFMCEKKN
jgi:hypothetical protein